MARQMTADTLVIASHNPGKVREINDLVAPFGVKAISAAELDLPEPVEDGDSFIANAEIKALSAATRSGLPSLADDSGLEIAALNGEPGIFSARWGGPEKDFQMAMGKVLAKLEGVGDRTANFTCALTLAWPDGHCESFEGKVFGTILDALKGSKGFGYDPIFQPNGYDISFGEMDPAEKHRISHRAKAFQQLIAACFHEGS